MEVEINIFISCFVKCGKLVLFGIYIVMLFNLKKNRIEYSNIF